MQSKLEIFLYTLGVALLTQLLFGVFVYQLVDNNPKNTQNEFIAREEFDNYLLSSLKSERLKREFEAALGVSSALARHKREASKYIFFK